MLAPAAEDTVRMDTDYSLYLVTDPALPAGRSMVDIVAAAIRGGVSCVQLREKDTPGGRFCGIAEQLLAVTRPAGIPLIINDRVDVMLATDADGVHVGQSDIPAERVRRLIGPHRILGVSVEAAEEVAPAIAAGADYLGASPVFPTPTKADTGRPLLFEGLRRICHASTVPVVAIGGMNHQNAAEAIAAGAAGIAVVRAIMAAEDPRAAAQQLREIIDRANG